jgi:hypothetical protein
MEKITTATTCPICGSTAAPVNSTKTGEQICCAECYEQLMKNPSTNVETPGKTFVAPLKAMNFINSQLEKSASDFPKRLEMNAVIQYGGNFRIPQALYVRLHVSGYPNHVYLAVASLYQGHIAPWEYRERWGKHPYQREAWIDDNSARFAKATLRNKNLDRTKACKFFGAKTPVKKIKREDVKRYVDWLIETNIASTSIHKFYYFLRSVMDYAIDHKMLRHNPCTDIILPARVYAETKVYDPEEVELLIKSARPVWLADMILLSYHTGMRKGECYGLKWDDITLVVSI